MDNKRLDEAVEVALSKYFEGFSHGNNTGVFYPEGTHEEAMRAALLASLPVLLGEPVAWQYQSKVNGEREWISCGKNLADTFAKHGHAIRPLYAPSLGEGHE